MATECFNPDRRQRVVEILAAGLRRQGGGEGERPDEPFDTGRSSTILDDRGDSGVAIGGTNCVTEHTA